MSTLITAERIPGAAVYGVEQMSYTVDGASGQDYAAALTVASLKEAVAIEKSLAAYSEVIRQRERKLDDLGEVMAALNRAISTLKPTNTQSSDKTERSAVLRKAYDLADKYGIKLGWVAFSDDSMQMNREQVYKAQNEVQYALDKEDNELKQDTVSMSSYMSKRDNAFSTASRVVKKAIKTASSTIGNLGG